MGTMIHVSHFYHFIINSIFFLEILIFSIFKNKYLCTINIVLRRSSILKQILRENSQHTKMPCFDVLGIATLRFTELKCLDFSPLLIELPSQKSMLIKYMIFLTDAAIGQCVIRIRDELL
jgi:hypothetical protein